MADLISRQDAIDALHGYFDGMLETDTWSPCDVYGLIEILPSAQPETHEERTKTHACDCIERQAAIDAIQKTSGMLMYQIDGFNRLDAVDIIKNLPSAQPELPDWAQKVEEYRKCAPSFVRNPLVWALYKTWKEYDERLFNHSRVERKTDGN